MIFVTLGTSDYPFTRLLKKLDELVEKNKIKNIKVQCNSEAYKSKNFKLVKTLEKKEYNKYIDDADIIITHGGVGTIIECAKKGKKVIAFPRKAEYGEAKNNHQEQITNELEKKGLIITGEINDLEKLINQVKNIKNVTFKSNNTKFNNRLCEIIDVL